MYATGSMISFLRRFANRSRKCCGLDGDVGVLAGKIGGHPRRHAELDHRPDRRELVRFDRCIDHFRDQIGDVGSKLRLLLFCLLRCFIT